MVTDTIQLVSGTVRGNQCQKPARLSSSLIDTLLTAKVPFGINKSNIHYLLHCVTQTIS